MHHIYHTEGLILGSHNFREAEKVFYIFTKDLGMISASAQGIRKISSKLRFVLQDFAYVKIDLVHGKEFWKITSALKTNKLENISKHSESFEIFTNIARLLKRLLAGEDANEVLFTDLIVGLSMLDKIDFARGVLAKIELQNIEVIIVLRMLHNLGYIGGDKIFENLIKSPFEEDLLFKVSKSRAKILSEINKALRETHL
ncbi:MAG: DNA repair protein RecO [Candidatus Paceibacterota bacterium]|jgi:DNA repair protein RecO